jgi:DNA-binding PadR family transcriptional regulator
MTLIEVQILTVAAAFAARGTREFHGFAAAKAIEEGGDSRRLTATGTLYRALHRLEGFGCLTSRWEDPAQAMMEGRPVRKLYELTAAGQAALARAAVEAPRARPSTRAEAEPT